MKNSFNDLDEILAKSQRLNSSFSDAATAARHLNRGVYELGEASRHLADNSHSTATGSQVQQPNGSATAMSLLSRMGSFGNQGIFEKMSVLPSVRSEDLSLEGTDLEGYLAHHHDMIILTSIEESRQLAEEHMQNMQRRWIDNEWEASKAAFMGSLGHRAHKWGIGDSTAPSSSTALAVYEAPKPIKDLTKSLNNSVLQAHAEAVAEINRSGSKSQPIRACHVLQEAAKGLDNSADSLGYRLLLTTLGHMVGETSGSPVKPGYFSSICLEKDHVPESARYERKSILSSGLKGFLENQQLGLWERNMQEAIANGDIRLDERNAGASVQHKFRRFLNYQYRIESFPASVELVTISASGEKNTISTTTRGQTSMRGSAAAAASSSPDIVPFWALIYHSIRCGKLDIALRELSDDNPSLIGEKEVAVVLRAIIARGTKPDNELASATPSKFPHSSEDLAKAMKKLEDLYKESTNKEVNTVDPYRAAVFNLVGLVDKCHIIMCGIPQFNFDDFLWANVWFVEVSRLISQDVHPPAFHSPFGTNAHMQLALVGPATSNKSTTDGEYELLEMIYALGGADYFDEHHNSPFKYALLLFACHRFGDAIVYLWQADKVFHATHLMILALHYGLILPHVPLHQNPSNPLVSSYFQTNTRETSFTNKHGAFALMPSSVIEQFLSNENMQQSASVCIGYLISLNSDWLANCQISTRDFKEYRERQVLTSNNVVASIIETFLMNLDVKQLHEIVGELLDNSTMLSSRGTTFRTHGLIEDYLRETRDVDAHLMNIARKFMNHHHNAEAAIHFFLLAGKFKEVVEVLVEELKNSLKFAIMSCVSSVSSSNANGVGRSASTLAGRDQCAIWMNKADYFISKYVKIPNSVIADAISQEGHQESLDFLCILMQLYHFMDEFSTGNNPIKALTIMDGLELIPSVEDHLRAVGPIHSRLRPLIDDIIMLLVEVIRQAYQVFKSKAPDGVSHRDSVLATLRVRSRVLAKYVQMVKSQLAKSDTVHYVARVDALLI